MNTINTSNAGNATNVTNAATFAGKIAFVTGGARGIGAAVVRRLAADGAAVAFTYQSSSGVADALAADIATAGGRALAINCLLYTSPSPRD